MISFLITCQSAIGQDYLIPKQAYSQDVKQIHSGHSLTDPLFHPWPGLYVELVTRQLGFWAGDNIGKSTIPGSPMFWRWQHSSGTPDARLDIADWELLSITEGVPLFYEGGNTADWYLMGLDSQRVYLSIWTNHAWQHGNGGLGAPTLLWTTWTNIDDSDGPWREMLDIQGQEWEIMQDYANSRRLPGAPPIYIIPGHKMMARIYDDIQLGLVPGISHISQLFEDNIHVNNIGSYAVAMIHYACIFNANPTGLPHALLDAIPPPTVEQAEYFQKIVWETVLNYPRSGLSHLLSKEDQLHSEEHWTISPNPAHTYITIQSDITEKGLITIMNTHGKVVLHSEATEKIFVGHLPAGIYLACLQLRGKLLTRKIVIY